MPMTKNTENAKGGPNDRRGEFIPETPSDIAGDEKREAEEGMEESTSKRVGGGIEAPLKEEDPGRRELWSPDDRFRESPLGGQRLER